MKGDTLRQLFFYKIIPSQKYGINVGPSLNGRWFIIIRIVKKKGHENNTYLHEVLISEFTSLQNQHLQPQYTGWHVCESSCSS
jgi:hypothetical protein